MPDASASTRFSSATPKAQANGPVRFDAAFSSSLAAERKGGKSSLSHVPGLCRPCFGCGETFQPRTTTGRPQLYCKEQCRRAAARRRDRARQGGATERTHVSAPFAEHPYARTLRAAIRRYGKPLRSLSDALEAEGVKLSAATLSAQQRGTYLPPSDSRVHALERGLGLAAGTLRVKLRQSTAAGPGHVGPDRRDDETRRLQKKIGQYTGTQLDHYLATAARDDVFVDEAGRPVRIAVQLTVLAVEEPVSGYWMIEAADTPGTRSEVRHGHACRVGHRILLDNDRTAIELLFDRTLRRGDSYRFHFSLEHRFTGVAAPFHRRCVLGPWVDDLQIHAHFARPPVAVWEAEWPSSRDAAPVRWRTKMVGPRFARMIRSTPAAGTYGLDWKAS